MSQKHRCKENFFVKRTKVLSNGELPIYMRITLNSECAEIGTGKSIKY